MTTTGFQLDTSGVIEGRSSTGCTLFWSRRWSDLTPFTQGYIEALFVELARRVDAEAGRESITLGGPQDWRFTDLAPETLARIIADCEAYLATHEHRKRCVDSETQGGSFWRIRQAAGYVRDSRCCDGRFEPLTVQLGDDGKVRFAA